MTFTEHKRASRPQVARRRDARTRILRAVYGPSVGTANTSFVWGTRDFARRYPPASRIETIRRDWLDADWTEAVLARVVADAGFGLNDL